MDKKLNVNKYLELQSQYININMNNQGYSKQINNKINLNQGKNFGPYVKIMRTKKLYNNWKFIFYFIFILIKFFI